MRVLLFGIVRERAGVPHLEVPESAATSVAVLRAHLTETRPELAPAVAASRVVVNGVYGLDETPIPPGAELAIIPPVSGGAEPWIAVITDPIDVAAVLRHVADPAAGGNTLFVGTVRDQHEGRKVRDLEYEAYLPMAEEELRRIAGAAKVRFNLLRVAVVHRIGRLAVGDAAIAVAVSAAHRGETFDAVSWIMHEIKHDVPVFKHEFYTDGTSAWVRCEHLDEGGIAHDRHHA